jgi:hypothetical protein
MVDYLMGEFIGTTFVRLQSIAVEVRSGFHVLTYQGLQGFLAAVLYHRGANLTAALQYGSYDCLPLRPANVDLFGPLVSVHIAGLAAYEGFVNFDFPAQLCRRSIRSALQAFRVAA